MPGRVPAHPRRGIGARRAAPAVTCLFAGALAAAFGAALLTSARADDAAKPTLDQTLKAEVGKIEIEIKFPTGEDRWAAFVKSTVERGLPPMIGEAGEPKDRAKIEIRYAAGGAETDGFEAALKPDAIFVRKKMPGGSTSYTGGVHGHSILYALARMWTEKAARPEWLRGGLAHLLVYQALKKCPLVYDARTYRDEILAQMSKADEAPLDQWLPAPPGAGAPPDSSVPLPQVARAFGFLYDANARLDGKVLKTLKELAGAGGEPASTKDFIAAVAKANEGKPVDEMFIGWAYVNLAPGGAAPKCDKTDLVDSDGDGLLNFEEDLLGTDKMKFSTAGDGIGDGEKVEDGVDPKLKATFRPKVIIDGNPKEWMRLKKFSFVDQEGDAKKDGDKAIVGTDLKKVNFCCDDKYYYVMFEADAFSNGDVSYQFCFDVGDDYDLSKEKVSAEEQKKVQWNYIVGFKTNGEKPATCWIGDTHNFHKDQTQAEWKNHVRMKVAVKDTIAEMRIPRSALDLPPKVLFMAYTSATNHEGKAFMADSVLRQVIELDKWKN